MNPPTDPALVLRRLASERAKRDAHRPGSAGAERHAGNVARLELEARRPAGAPVDPKARRA